MSARIVRAARGALVLLLCVPAVLFAHSAPSAGSISGTVKDGTGKPLPNVQVLVAELGRVTATGNDGRFVLSGVVGGSYHITASLIGYRPTHADVTVSDGDAVVVLTLIQSPLRLSSVVISATVTSGDASQQTQAATELSGKALNRSLGASIAQTLATEPGMAMRFNGPAANAPIIRGLQGDRILVLQDGERTGDLSSAAPDHSVSIDPLAAQRMEVVRGPSSLLYGNNALGGVVNVISNDIPSSVPSHVVGAWSSQGESATPGGATYLTLTAPLGSSVALTVRGGVRSAGDQKVGGGGTLVETQSRSWNGTVGLGFTGARVNGGIVVRNYDFNYGLPTEPGSPDVGTHIAGNRLGVSGKLQFAGNDAFPGVTIDGTTQQYKHDELSPEGSVNTSFNLKTQTLNAAAKTAFGRVRGSIGVQGLFKQYASTGDEALTPAANTVSGGAYLYQEIPLRDGNSDARVPRLQIGGRYDSYRIESTTGAAKFGLGKTIDISSASGSVGLSLPLSDAVTLSVSAARAFRAPTVEELFSNAFHSAAGTYDRGNPNLKAETNAGFDGILRVQSGGFSGSVSGYYNRINNYVAPSILKDTIIDGAKVPLNNFTQGDATLYGVEGSLETVIAPHLVGGLMGDLVHGAFAGGGPLPFIPPARVGASLRWDDGKWSLGGDTRHAFNQARVSGGEVDIPTAAYTVIDLNAGYQIILNGLVHSVTLRLDNITDSKYYDASSRIKSFAPNPGRNIAMVYKVLF
jgi:iron complex outermembrane receptor protein